MIEHQTLFKDQLALLIEQQMAICCDDNLDTVIRMFYAIKKLQNKPEAALLMNKSTHQAYFVPDFYL